MRYRPHKIQSSFSQGLVGRLQSLFNLPLKGAGSSLAGKTKSRLLFKWRPVLSSLDWVHVIWMSVYVGFSMLALVGSVFRMPIITAYQAELVLAAATLLSAWMVFDFAFPALPVSKKYLLLHHAIAASAIAISIYYKFFIPCAWAIFLQEGYTLVFKKIIHAPILGLQADLLRFVISGGLLIFYLTEVNILIILCWLFFIFNNMYFFRVTHIKALRGD